MNIPKRHHYLPQFFIRNFTSSDKVWVYYKNVRKGEDRYKYVTTKGIGWERNFYRFKGKEGNFNYGLETQLFNKIDDRGATVVGKVLRQQELSDEEEVDFANFIAFQYLRGPAFESFYNNFGETVFRAIIPFINQFNERKAKISGKPREPVLPTNFTVQFPRENSLEAMLDFSMELVNIILNFDWVFARPHGNYSFVTSDFPFLLTPPIPYNPYLNVGLLTTGSMKIVPLASKLCLILRDPGKGIIETKLYNSEVRNVNNLLYRHSSEYLIAGDKPLLESLVKNNLTP